MITRGYTNRRPPSAVEGSTAVARDDIDQGFGPPPPRPSAVYVLAALLRVPGNPWVVPGAKPGTHMADIDGAWQTIRARAGLDDVRIHDIRHSCAV